MSNNLVSWYESIAKIGYTSTVYIATIPNHGMQSLPLELRFTYTICFKHETRVRLDPTLKIEGLGTLVKKEITPLIMNIIDGVVPELHMNAAAFERRNLWFEFLVAQRFAKAIKPLGYWLDDTFELEKALIDVSRLDE
jgi:hypothetical protein